MYAIYATCAIYIYKAICYLLLLLWIPVGFTIQTLDLVLKNQSSRNIHPEVFLGQNILKICSKFTGEHPCRSVISIKL